ncbi:hypothetical protein DB88DRAFT_486874 [Papiliotrema laurentii]|uniref:Uncharacterized protein n=1 Tax=Papiliotrema laurentii TaxID=5418 RepID=A0AAD9L6X9_PAPLA|nr:hypothetical protein DB88DRAFT_486874 [Papiliotrema laurentii]
MSLNRLRLALPPLRTGMRSLNSTTSSIHDNDPNRLAKEKARNLSGEQDSSAPHKEHAPGWNEHLASESEANVKADQAGPRGKPGRDLQEQTIKQTHEHHHTEAGHKGAEAHVEKPASRTGSEEAVKADRGEHH